MYLFVTRWLEPSMWLDSTQLITRLKSRDSDNIGLTHLATMDSALGGIFRSGPSLVIAYCTWLWVWYQNGLPESPRCIRRPLMYLLCSKSIGQLTCISSYLFAQHCDASRIIQQSQWWFWFSTSIQSWGRNAVNEDKCQRVTEAEVWFSE